MYLSAWQAQHNMLAKKPDGNELEGTEETIGMAIARACIK